MSLKILSAIEEKTAAIPTGLSPAINGSVRLAQQNYREITGINRNRSFFYREAAGFDHKRTLAQRFAAFYFANAFASKQGGDLFEQEVQSWFETRKVLQAPTLFQALDFWQAEDRLNGLQSQLRRAHLNADRMETRKTLVSMRRTIDELLRQTEVMPELEKR